jgi:hypothetical protein
LNNRPLVRRGLLACTILFLFWLAWQALSGAVRQASHSRTMGQKIETVVQSENGILSLLVVLTCFWQRRSDETIRTIWSISLAAAAGVSSLVWGPPMPLVGGLFVAVALLVSRVVTWALRTGLAEKPSEQAVVRNYHQ